MKNGIYLEEALKDVLRTSNFVHGMFNLIDAPCGSGKTTAAINVISKLASSPRTALILIDTTNGKQRLARLNELTMPYAFYEESLTQTWFPSAKFDPTKIVVTTYAQFGVWEYHNSGFHYFFDIIICDEAHNMIRFPNFRKKKQEAVKINYAAIARDAICRAVWNCDTLVVGMTATQDNISQLNCYINPMPIDTAALRQYENKNVYCYASLPQLLRYLPKGKRGALYVSQVEKMQEHEQVAIAAGFAPICVWSPNAEHPMTKEQEAARRYGLYEVAPANQVERLIREYDLLCSAGIQMMRVYNGVSDRILCSSKSDYNRPIIGLIVDGDKTDKCGTGHINTFLRAARARYWRELFDLPELRQKMTSAMQDEYHSTIERMKDYEFSQFNIQQVVNQIMGQIVPGVEEAIVKCFDKLSAEHSYHSDVQNENVHYYNGWKTNKAHYVNSKCIIPTYGCFARGYKPDKYGRYKDTLEGLDARGCFQVLDDLEKALDYLDKGETPASDLSTKLQHAANSGRTTVSCKYFMVTFYKKGTCHIKFHDQKIVGRLNIYVGRQRAWLPPTYGSAHYDQMDDESRRVVDEFQGREKYEAVINCPNDYIIETKAAPLLLM